jgi:hypothetical protein
MNWTIGYKPASTDPLIETLGKHLKQGSQNGNSIVWFYDFTIQTNHSDSTIFVSRNHISMIPIVKILRFAILSSELHSDSESRFSLP